jgi:UDP-glucose 4-epimerase
MHRQPVRSLVLGGCGFMGSNVVEKLLADGHHVRVFDTPSASRVNLAAVESQIDFFEGDFLNGADVDRAVQDVDFIFHLVGTTLPANSNSRPTFDVESNILPTIALLQASVRYGVKRIIFASSGGTVYGEPQKIPISEDHPTEPLCSYGITKLAIEKYLQLFRHLYGLDYTILRIANPYGKNQRLTAQQGVVGVFLSRISQDQTITIWGNGSVTRDYVYIDDVARAFVKAITQDSPYRVFNIGTGTGVSLLDLVSKIERVTSRKAKVEFSAARPMDVSTNILDPTRANEYMNWHAETDCDRGLCKTWAWLCESRRELPTATRVTSTGTR